MMFYSIKVFIYKIVPSWVYYKVAFFIKKRRLKKFNKIVCSENNSVSIFNLLKNKKNNSKVFIFGSGSSINELSFKNYEEINDNCSIGINNWAFHNFVTNYYMIELGVDEKHNERFRLRILSLLKNKLKKPVFLIYVSYQNIIDPIKLKNWMKEMDPKRVFLYDYIRPDTFKKNFKTQFLKTLKLLSEKNKVSNVLTLGLGASLERAISLTILLNYSKIILLGVDLRNTKVFWSNKDSNFKDIHSGQKSFGFHKTALQKINGLPVQRSIKILDELAREQFNSRILISTKKSLLSSKLQKYKWQKYD